jgi:arsenite oxidase small subunit
MPETNRRRFLQAGVAGGVLAIPQMLPSRGGSAVAAPSAAAATAARLTCPEVVICNVQDVTMTKPVMFSYPDGQSPCILIKTGGPVPGGSGPDQDLLAYSRLCPHQGCPVQYDAGDKVFRCPCHFSRFDGEKKGQMICGQATGPLPVIDITVDGAGRVIARGVTGLIYGRQANII